MNWDEAMALMHGADWKHAKIGLERMRDLLHLLGDPDKKLKFVHIAGTNGKGSASAMTASILKEAGFVTGLYISPNVGAFNERIQINGEYISDCELKEVFLKVKDAVSRLEEEPVDFELITAAALLYFAEKKCDIVVLEVGMGGRLDATNVIDPPLVAAIMNIGLDHTAVLGNTIGKIAGEKAGIIKHGSDVVVYSQSDEAISPIRKKFAEVSGDGDLLVITDPSKVKILEQNLYEQKFVYPLFGNEILKLGMVGTYQVYNALVVLHVILTLRKKGFRISDDAVKNGLAAARWLGRFEVLNNDPVVIVDGAHNPNGVRALVRSLEDHFPDRKFIFVMGVMADKDYGEMLELTAPLADTFIAELPDNERALKVESLEKEIRRHFKGAVITFPSVKKAVKEAVRLSCEKTARPPVICFGSLFQVKEIRELFS